MNLFRGIQLFVADQFFSYPQQALTPSLDVFGYQPARQCTWLDAFLFCKKLQEVENIVVEEDVDIGLGQTHE